MKTDNLSASEIIDALGGTSVVADLCEVTTGGVSIWRRKGIPRARLMYLKAVRPKVFRKLSENKTEQ
jgi:hypothetical protein